MAIIETDCNEFNNLNSIYQVSGNTDGLDVVIKVYIYRTGRSSNRR